MEITEVRIKLISNPGDRLRGFCSVTFDNCFVVRDLKIIEGNTGPFVAMPSRKLTDGCPKCRTKNHLRAKFCNECGAKLALERIEHDAGGRAKLYADVAHPVNASCRQMIQERVIQELNQELERAALPGYCPKYDDDYFDEEIDVQGENEHEKSMVSSGIGGQNDVLVTTARIDPAEEKPYKTHKPHLDTSEATNSVDEEFGKGIFE